MWSRYARGAVKVCSRCGEVRSWCGRGMVVVQSRYTHGVVEVRSPVRFRFGVVL